MKNDGGDVHVPFQVIQGDLNKQAERVVDFEVERAERAEEAAGVRPISLLKMALKDAQKDNTIVKAYVTLIRDDKDSFSTINYRAGLKRTEEIAFRQLGVQEALEGWREDK